MLNNENQRAPPIRILMQILFAYISREKKKNIIDLLYYIIKHVPRSSLVPRNTVSLMKSLNAEALVMLCNHEVKRNNIHVFINLFMSLIIYNTYIIHKQFLGSHTILHFTTANNPAKVFISRCLFIFLVIIAGPVASL